jgi:hypothetical protein
VNAASLWRMFLRTMHCERSRCLPLTYVQVGPRRSERMRSMPCPVGAGRMRAPLALGANGECAVRHRRDDANILLRDSHVNALREAITRTTIA